MISLMSGRRMIKLINGFLFKRNPFFIFFLIPFILVAMAVSAEDGVSFMFGSSNKLKITERSNISVYEDGSFKGLTYNESRAVLDYVQYRDGFSRYSGNYYVYEASKKDTRLISNPVNLNERCDIEISDRGVYRLPENVLVPVLRSFPVFPEKDLKPGDKWRDFGERIVDPDNSGNYTKVKFYCEYRYDGLQEGVNGPKHVITAQYAMRYKPGDTALADPSLEQLSGKHLVNIYIDDRDRSSIFIRDKLEEQYRFFSGRTLRHTGFILTWYNDVVGFDRKIVAEQTEKVIEEDKIDDIELVERAEGLALNIKKLHFVPDSPEILPEETGRLKAIYELLSKLYIKKILVVGHTADVGTKESQYALSRQRALAVIDKLVALGMNPAVFLYEGRGGDEPLEDNSIEAGRAANRRVELILLDD